MESLHTSFFRPRQYGLDFVVKQNLCCQQLEDMAENISARTGFASVAKCEKRATSICQGCILVQRLGETPRLIFLWTGIEVRVAMDGELGNSDAGSTREMHAVW